MADNTRIEWTDSTWNPIVGCSRASEGCQHCYAERMAHRLGSNPTMQGRYAGLTDARGAWTGEARFIREALEQPFHWKRPRRIFVGSMTDLFHDSVPDEWIYSVLAVVALNPRHTFMVLTKRAARMRHFMATNQKSLRKRIEDTAMEHFGEEAWAFAANSMIGALKPALNVGWPMRNLWLGVTAENQARADERIPLLLETPAAVRFVSIEPMLGPVDLERYIEVGLMKGKYPKYKLLPTLGWVIAGGETGPGARPMHPDWARSLRDQCAAAGVPFFFKSWGEWRPASTRQEAADIQGKHWTFARRDPEDKRPNMGGCYHVPDQLAACVGKPETYGWQWPTAKVGKAKAGHLIDGREHLEFPEAAHE